MLGEFVDDYTVCTPEPKKRRRVPLLANIILTPDLLCRRLCDAAERNNSDSRVGRPRLPDQDVGHAQTDWQVSRFAPLVLLERS